MKIKNRLWWGIPGILLAASFSLSLAFAQTAPVIKANIIRDFGRISFEWPAEVRLKAGTNGNQLRITFEQPANINPAPILRNLRPYITNVQQSADGRSLTLTMNRPYQIRSFVSSNVNGIDILHLNEDQTGVAIARSIPPAPLAPPAPKLQLAASPAENSAKAVKKLEAVTAKQEKSLIAAFAAPPKPKAKPASKPKEVAETALAAQDTAIPAKTQVESTPEKDALSPPPLATVKEEAKAEPEANVKKAEASSKSVADSSKAMAAEPEKISIPATAEAASMKAPAQHTPTSGAITITAETVEGKTLLHFPWQERVAATAFRRGNRDYIYFNNPAEMNINALKAVTEIEELSLAPLGKGQLLVLKTAKPGLVVDKGPNEYAWHFQLTSMAMPPLHPIRSAPQTEPPLKPHLLLPVLETDDGIAYDDPHTGDSLILIPSYHPGDGVSPSREFVDLELLTTAQGIVVRPKADNLRVARMRNGMKITSPKGLTLSTDLPPLNIMDIATIVDGDGTFFPYELWKTPDGKEPYHFANEILAEIPMAAAAQKQAFRLRLAQLYLAEERPHEALGLLDLIRREAPEFYTRNKLMALHGAANFLAYRYHEALANFADPVLDDYPEIPLWRDTLGILLTNDGKANYLDYYQNFISKYPPYFSTRLALAAVDMLIQHQQYNTALKIFDTLNRAKIIGPIRDYVDFQVASISAATNQKKIAEKIWEKLGNSPDNFIRSRASFALTNYLLREARITIPEAIKRLEPLRIVWRGDDFELGLLHFMGDLYEANNQPREALRAYREITQYFPDNPGNLALLEKMSDMFVSLFNGGAADKMEPLEALALYYEFRDLTPVEEEGDKMVQHLAERLVGVDLLDRAAALLEHQVRFRLAGAERSRVGAQLALIELFNRKPKQALEALELTGYGQNPEALQHSRTLLTARALADLGEYKRATKLLEGDESTDAATLRLGFYWDQKDWKHVIATAESILGQRNDPSAPISDDESNVLLKLALAYVFERQNEQVQYLRDYFLPLMKGNKNEHLFEFITQDAPVDYRNLAQLTRHLSNVENFLSTYRKKLQEKGLSKAIP